jgi:hypothetical protein
VFNVERYLDAPPPDDVEPIDAVRYFLLAGDHEAGLDDPTQRHIRVRGGQAAGAGPADLVERFDAARARLAPRLADLPESQPVLVFDLWLLRLDQCLITSRANRRARAPATCPTTATNDRRSVRATCDR